jgi:hypothetical protein
MVPFFRANTGIRGPNGRTFGQQERRRMDVEIGQQWGIKSCNGEYKNQFCIVKDEVNFEKETSFQNLTL